MKSSEVAGVRPPHPVFTGGSIASALITSVDWSQTAVGPEEGWPDSLRTIVSMMLCSRQPMFLWWGPELVQFYNDAYIPSFGIGKHPAAMGQRGIDCWGEIWPIIHPQIQDVMLRRKASWNEDALIPIFRNGRIEEVYWTYGYSPVLDERGDVAGTLVVCTETTTRVVLERRLEILRRVAQATAACDDVSSLLEVALGSLADAQLDLPFALVYGGDDPGSEPARAAVNLESYLWGDIDGAARDILRSRENKHEVTVEAFRLPDGIVVPAKQWPEPITEICVLRAAEAGVGTLVIGLSSRLSFDAAYRRFVHDLIEQVDFAASRLEAFRARALMEAERRNLLLQAPVAAALMIGPAHVFELANRRYLQMVGREVVGKAYLEAFPELGGTALPEILDRVYATGEPFVAEEYFVPLARPDDGRVEDHFFKFNLEPVRDAAGAVYGMMAVAVDITEQVSARRSLEQTNLEREKLVDELKAAGIAKDAFLATVSHELRTPLNAILGWSRMLRSGQVAPERLDHALSVIERNAAAQVQLIEDLLDVSRIISGKLRLDVHPLSLVSVVEAAIDSVQHAVTSKSLRLQRVIDPDAGSIVGDTHRLQQVLWNLLSNAVKFTPKGGTVKVVVERVDSTIHLTVSDSGQGIPASLLSSVFDRFRQADGSAARVHGGLGLGLAIARHIVELHGGTIEAHSEGEGRGATFVVALPTTPLRSRPRGPFRHPVTSEASSHLEPVHDLQGLTVLIVDDEQDTRELLSEVLFQHGVSVLLASNAKEALEVLDRASPRVLVSDIGMPEVDGYSLIEAVRKRPAERGGRTVALALTAYASAEDRRRALRAGFQMHLAKPVEPAEFVAMLATLAQLAIAMK